MLRGAALLVGLVATTLFAQDSNKDLDSFDIEPPLLILNRDEQQQAKPAASPARDLDLAKLERERARAKRNAAGAERLCKIGALSQLEVEQRELHLVHLEFDLANARLLCAKEEMLAKEKQLSAGEIAKSDLAQTETTLALAIEAAHAASMKQDQAEIDAAEANVRRQEKLLALGSARKTDVERAVQKLTNLKSQKDESLQ
jgi:hypothetical protein